MTAAMRAHGLLPPSIVFEGRAWPSQELAARAGGWLEPLNASIPDAAELTAVPMVNHPDAVALFFALSALRRPIVVLPPDALAWRTAPAVPAGTPVCLLPSLRALAPAAESLGLRPVVLPDARPASRRPEPPFLTMPGIVVFTSGSTGPPKPIYFLTSSTLRQIDAIVAACGLRPGDGIAGSLPLSTPFGLVRTVLVAAALGSTLGLLERFSPRHLLDLFASGAYAHWVGTPLMAEMLTRASVPGRRPPVPRDCHVGTGRLAERVSETFLQRFGVPLRPAYGLAECGGIGVETAPAAEIRRDCVGRALPGVEIRIGDDPLAPEPAGRSGRIWLTCPWLMEGYGYPPRVAPREERHGWWATPDVGTLDAAGYLTLIGRVDDCFKTASGHLVNPGEITNALMSHPGVSDVLVMPVPRGPDGVMIGALAEGPGTLDPDALHATAARALPPWLRPHVVRVVERLPRLAGGKPDRAACAAILGGAPGAPASA